MPDDRDSIDPSAKVFIQHLEETGFFRHISDLDKNLRSIAEDIKVLGENAAKRIEQVENLAAHILAIEAVLSVLLRGREIDLDAVRQLIRSRSSRAGTEEISETIETLAESLVMSSRN